MCSNAWGPVAESEATEQLNNNVQTEEAIHLLLRYFLLCFIFCKTAVAWTVRFLPMLSIPVSDTAHSRRGCLPVFAADIAEPGSVCSLPWANVSIFRR